MHAATTRRALLGRACLAAALAIPAMGASRPAAAAIRDEFARAHAAIGAREAELSLHVPVFDAARARWVAAKDAIPHTTFYAGTSIMGKPMRYATESPSMIAICRQRVRDAIDKREPDVADARRLIVAHTNRERRLTRIGRDTGMDAAFDRDGVLGDALAAAEDAFVAMPAVSLAELRLKTETANDRDLWSNPDVVKAISIDVLRLTEGQ